MPDDVDPAGLAHRVAEGYPGSLSPVATILTGSRVVLHGEVDHRHHAGNGYLHAGALVTLADTACGYGTMAGLPEGSVGFTTVELKSNHLSTITSGSLVVTAERIHAGRTTQVWDASVAAVDTGRTLMLFRCTQMILYPR